MKLWSEHDVRRAFEVAYDQICGRNSTSGANPFRQTLPGGYLDGTLTLIGAVVLGMQTLLNQQAQEFDRHVREIIFANGTLENVNTEMIERACELLGGIAVRRLAEDKNKIGSGG